MSSRPSPGGSRTQVNRLLALVPYLQARGEVSVQEAAREFGVTPGTIRRDINVLLFCGLPGLGMGDLIDVDFDALEGEGVIRLSNADFLARPLRLDSTEAAALVVGLRALLEGGREAEREVVARALRKIEEAAGEAAGVAAQVDIRVAEDPDEQALGSVLGRAVAGRRQVRLTHRSPTRDEVTVRVVDPIAITTSEGHSYLDAWCHLVEDRRLFRLDRVADAELLDTPVTEHASAEPLDLSEGIYRPSPDDLLARLRVAPQARWVTEYFPVEEVAEEPDGSLLVSLRVGNPAWLVRLALRLGGHAVVVEPEELAEAVRRSAEEALSNYG
ncbi:helix-turn-helix transcriptional regulator [Nocardioides caldifontis]|uniref:helix-turn-helix transcriptional regulator n=1 Tax=Nocardioides caldifontis TaxID=2588938 RepID=UPI0011E0293A|nr:YafY family protein [Nocardioides caldifontis]